MSRLIKVLERLLALAFIFAVCLNFANVFGRYLIGRSLSGADEVQVYIMVWMAFLGAAAVAWRRQHLRMDVLVRYLPQAAQRTLKSVEVMLTVLLAGFVVVQSARYTWQMVVLGRSSDVAGIPMWIAHAAVAFGFGLIAVIVVMQLFRPK
jgi:TRAP-type C4-dicarboxylate transport system permease small subunit